MADFVAVLKKTIDGMGENSPETRARVYDRARAAISAKLAAITPPPAPAVVQRQKDLLEEAIASVEADYAPAVASIDDDFDAILASLEKQTVPASAVPPKAPPSAPAPVKAQPAPAKEPVVTAPAASTTREPNAANDASRAPQATVASNAGSEQRRPARAPRRGRGGLVAVALIALVFISAAAYAVWLNRDEVSQMIGMSLPTTPETEPAQSAPETPAPQNTAAAPAAEQPTPAEPVAKFTQKLNPDGSETDTGPAGGSPAVGEGTSVAELTVPAPVPAATPPAEQTPPAASQPETPPAAEPVQAAPATPAAPAAAAEPAQQQVAVGQKAIFYEERTSATDGSAQQGNTVWSVVQESPGGDLPPEPAIRAEASIPGKDIQLRMTIRRNADPTLPASHIVELIFLTPENFEGGVIDNLLRMTFKETEEATGNPLIGSAAKIGDGFFMIALSDGKQEIEANTQLFRRMKWIDIPIVYRSGRRALMTLERGIPGDRAFEEAIAAWAAKSG